MAQNDNNICSLLGITTTTIMVITTTLTLMLMPGFSVSPVYGQVNNDSGTIITRGGGAGSITCPDGSSKQAVIAFVVSANGSNAKITTTNWNINELPSNQNPNPGFASGSFNSVNVNSGKFEIVGQKINEAQFCQPPLSLPVTVSGSCGQNVAISVKFQSNNPVLMTGGTFTGDVTCSQTTASNR
ncbi:MAG: hypothetical protein ACJ705_07010 [Nitrososphaeraceae archaeon]